MTDPKPGREFNYKPSAADRDPWQRWRAYRRARIIVGSIPLLFAGGLPLVMDLVHAF
jgi:hypothetical protein